MNTLTAADMRLALDNLYSDAARYNLFKTTAAFIVYGGSLDAARADLPLTLKGNRPMAKDLSVADGAHDGAGSALYKLTEAILEQPFASQSLKEKAQRIQSAFIPTRSVLQAKYKKEAQAARANRDKVTAMEADLKSIPTPDGRTAFEWVNDFLDSGDKLGELLDARSKVEADEPGSALVLARTKTLTTVLKARDLVREEAEATSKLPKNAEAILFGYFDTLASFRSNAKNEDEEPPPAAPPPAAEPKRPENG